MFGTVTSVPAFLIKSHIRKLCNLGKEKNYSLNWCDQCVRTLGGVTDLLPFKRLLSFGLALLFRFSCVANKARTTQPLVFFSYKMGIIPSPQLSGHYHGNPVQIAKWFARYKGATKLIIRVSINSTFNFVG
jgi:hypothetical protein